MSSVKKIYCSNKQKEVLIDILQNEEQLISGKFTQKFTFKDAQNKWTEIATILNSIPAGTQKDWKQWRKVIIHTNPVGNTCTIKYHYSFF